MSPPSRSKLTKYVIIGCACPIGGNTSSPSTLTRLAQLGCVPGIIAGPVAAFSGTEEDRPPTEPSCRPFPTSRATLRFSAMSYRRTGGQWPLGRWKRGGLTSNASAA